MQKIEKMIVTSRPVNLLILFICFIPFLFLGIFDLDEGVDHDVAVKGRGEVLLACAGHSLSFLYL